MSNRAAILDSSWKVFFDGVEVPHQGFSVRFLRDGLSTANVILEPDILLTAMRPQTVVTILARERFIEDDAEYTSVRDDFLNRYYLYWEGLVSGYTYQKAHDARSINVACESMFSVLQRTKAFSFAVGPYVYSPILSGSVSVNPNQEVQQDVFTLVTLANQFTVADKTTFTDRLISIVGFLTSANAVLRLQTVRYNLLHKIAGINDDVYEGLLGPLAAGIVENMTQSLDETTSVFGVLNHLQSYGFFHSVQIPIPVPGQTGRSITKRSYLNTSPIYDITAAFNRTDLLFVPENYFTLPPPCNLIFPDMLQSVDVTRDFYSEPTRTIVSDPLIATDGRVLYLAPPSLLRDLSDSERGSMTGAGVFAASISLLTNDTVGLGSPYESHIGGSTINLLRATADNELEKGIVVRSEQYLFEVLSSYARAAAVPNQSNTQLVEMYAAFITQVVNYRHKLSQFSREMRVLVNGHRYLVPGFTAAVFDSDISYLASVDAVSFDVNPVGYETTNVVLTQARPLIIPSEEAVSRLYNEIEALATTLRISENAESQNIFISEAEAAENIALFRSLTAISIDAITNKYMLELDIPIPPEFIGTAYSTAEKLDATYVSVLGCKPLYTGPFRSAGLSDAASDILTPSLQYLLTYIEGLRTLMNTYVGSEGKSVPCWQDVFRDKNALGPGTVEWSHRNLIKRRRVYAREYLEQSRLRPYEVTSNGPSRHVFLHLVPTENPNSDPAVWDNSILSKLVTETQRVPLVQTVDPVIEQLRNEAPDYLRTVNRQALYLKYSKQHMGGRAFDGT